MYLARQLRARESSFIFPSDSTTSISTLVEDLVSSLIRRFDFNSWSTWTIINVFEFCFEMDHRGHCADILNKLLEEKMFTPNHISTHLIPLARDLPTFLSKQNVPPSCQPYAAFFKTSAFAWVKKVLGPKPEVPAQLPQTLSHLRRCCQTCQSLANSLESGSANTRVINLDRVGAQQAKHLDTAMATCCRNSIATWNVINTTPRGFTVSQCMSPLDWT